MLYPMDHGFFIIGLECCYSVLGVTFWRVKLFIEGLGEKKKNKQTKGFQGFHQLHLRFMLLHLFLNSKYANIVHFP